MEQEKADKVKRKFLPIKRKFLLMAPIKLYFQEKHSARAHGPENEKCGFMFQNGTLASRNKYKSELKEDCCILMPGEAVAGAQPLKDGVPSNEKCFEC